MGIFFFFQAEDGIRDYKVTGVQTCALPILRNGTDLFFNAVGDSRRFSRRCQCLLSGCQRVRKPMRRGGGGGGGMSSRVASKTTLNWAADFFLSSSRRFANPFFGAISSRHRTKGRTQRAPIS